MGIGIKMKEKVNKEHAEKELNDFFEAMDIDTTRSTPQAQKFVDNVKAIILEHVILGHAKFNEDHEPVIIPWRSKGYDPLTMREPTGSNLMAAGVEESAYKADLMVMAELTKTSVSKLSSLKAGEIKLLRAFYTFFTA